MQLIYRAINYNKEIYEKFILQNIYNSLKYVKNIGIEKSISVSDML